MVSIRKWRHLGVQERYKILNQLSRINERKRAMEPKSLVEEVSYHSHDSNISERGSEKNQVLEVEPTSSFPVCDNLLIDSNSAQERDFSSGNVSKIKKASRRKQSENQDPCLLRGVYFKNMKWQAAIKVEKKQIHLGTVASMEEAAHLYDRAAYLCGRVPNFELSEEEKQELRGLQWEDFLQITKDAIASKKKQKRVDNYVRRRRSSDPLEDSRENTLSFHQSYQHSQPFEETAYHQHASSYHQSPSFDEGAAYQYRANYDESGHVFQQAATPASFQHGHPPHSALYEQSAAGLPVEGRLGSLYQKPPVFSSDYYIPAPVHQQTIFAGNSSFP
ncbi:hypothetical protein GOP47_0016682 [Adiantum capillus-veneris]|uniref:AP2/ERF domain-containing protein n=1 Tax=Adiantum capillus-veneris TaxID=13818 RepID=A0A9D4UIS8_ADICA|nr:hypothetical protein GOP47_0016682 [Adiantum capillus-veneris]